MTAPLSDLCHAAAADPPPARRGPARSSLLAMLQQADMQWHAHQRAVSHCLRTAFIALELSTTPSASVMP